MRRSVKPGAGNTAMGSLFDLPSGVEPQLPVHPSVKRAAERYLSRREMKEDDAAVTFEPLKPSSRQRHLRFISFGSGSSGNCAYVGDEHSGFLIDAGVDVRLVEETLLRNGVDMDSVKGICLTHDHSDHIRYVYALCRRFRHLVIYCTPKTLNGILRRHSISRRIKDYHHPIYKEFPFRIDNFELTAFDVSHDGTDNAGFYVTNGDTLRFAVATDLGCITERVDHYMRQARFVMIESNYDAGMLERGRYPEYLKARIRAGRGHLDNVEAGRFLADMFTPALTHVFLCHLSLDNNTPELALHSVEGALLASGKVGSTGDASGTPESLSADVQLVALPRYVASPMYYLF